MNTIAYQHRNRQSLYLVFALLAAFCSQSPGEESSTKYSVPSTQYLVASCPGGECPIPYAPLAPRPFSSPPIRNPPSSIHQLSSAAFDTVVKVQTDNGHGGSGVLVECDGQAVILTAEHVVRGAAGASVSFRDGQQFRSQEILVDRHQLDLAAVLIAWPRRITPAPLGEMPRSGDTVIACGYGADDTLAGLPNTVRGVRFSRISHDSAEPDSLEMLGTFRSGDSGGPVFDRAERVVAIVNASSAPGAAYQSNVAVSCRPIRAFLTRLRDRLARGKQQPAKPAPDEIVPGLAVPQVEMPAESGCHCDNAAVLKKLEQIGETLRDVARQKDIGAVAAGQSVVQSEINSLKSAILQRAPAAGMTAGKLVAAALGLSTPVGIGLGIAGWIAGRGVRRRLNRKTGDGNDRGLAAEDRGLAPVRSPIERTVILETPPPPQVVERSQQYVPYQVQSSRLDALERAMAEYVRKYPSAAGIFETINVYANQFESGEAKAVASGQ